MKTNKIEKHDHLDDIKIDLDVFFNEIDNNLFYSQEWFQNYEKNIPEDYAVERVYSVEAGSTEQDSSLRVAALILFKKITHKSYFFKYFCLESLANYYSTYHSILISRNTDSMSAIESIVSSINSDNEVSALNIGPVVSDNVDIKLLEDELRKQGWFTYHYEMFGNWRLHLEGRSFDEYYTSVPSKVRNTIKRKGNKLFREHEVEYKLFHDEQGLSEGIEYYEQVYNNSWKEKEPYADFIRGLISFSARNGWLRLGIILVSQQPVAAQLWIIKDKVAYIYKLSYTEASKKLSAGSVLTEKLMRHAIDVDQVEVIDYLTGDDPYKKDWMSERRQMTGIMAYRPSFKGRLLTLGYKIKNIIKRLARSKQDD